MNTKTLILPPTATSSKVSVYLQATSCSLQYLNLRFESIRFT